MTLPLVPRSGRRRPWPPRPLPGWKMCRRRYAHESAMLRCTSAEGHRDDHTFLTGAGDVIRIPKARR